MVKSLISKLLYVFDSLVELDYYRHGGILQMVLKINLRSNLI